MDLVLFAAVDNDLNFPPEIRNRLIHSEELRHLVTPMSQATRENLTDEERWPGRFIFNTTKKTLEYWYGSSWATFLIEPPPDIRSGWDADYTDQVPSRIQLALSPEFKNMIIPMVQTSIDNLSESDLWDGRTIYNKTIQKLQTWSELTALWTSLLDETYIPNPPEVDRQYSYGDQSDIWKFDSGATPYDLFGYTRTVMVDNKVSFNFQFHRNTPIDRDPLTGSQFKINLPISAKDTNMAIGVCKFKGVSDENIIGKVVKSPGENYLRIEYTASDGKLYRLKDNSPLESWGIYKDFYGHIIYESA